MRRACLQTAHILYSCILLFPCYWISPLHQRFPFLQGPKKVRAGSVGNMYHQKCTKNPEHCVADCSCCRGMCHISSDTLTVLGALTEGLETEHPHQGLAKNKGTQKATHQYVSYMSVCRAKEVLETSLGSIQFLSLRPNL